MGNFNRKLFIVCNKIEQGLNFQNIRDYDFTLIFADCKIAPAER
jgi:hypothetical protein